MYRNHGVVWKEEDKLALQKMTSVMVLPHSDHWYLCCFGISNVFALTMSLYLVLMFKDQRFFLHAVYGQEQVTLSRRAGRTGLYFLACFSYVLFLGLQNTMIFKNFLLSCENHFNKQTNKRYNWCQESICLCLFFLNWICLSFNF